MSSEGDSVKGEMAKTELVGPELPIHLVTVYADRAEIKRRFPVTLAVHFPAPPLPFSSRPLFPTEGAVDRRG